MEIVPPTKTKPVMKRGFLEFSYFYSMRSYQLWSILNMSMGPKRDEALKKLVKVHPPEKWGMRTFHVLNKYLTCKRVGLFTHKLEKVVALLGDLRLNDFHNIIIKGRVFEAKMMPYREFNKEGSAVFGPVDRIRIFVDKLEEVYGEFRPVQAQAA